MTQAIPMCWCGGNQNFGDWIGPCIVEQVTGRPIIRSDSAHDVLITSGSILNWATAGAIVWGAGLANRSDRVDPRADIRAVRGPISRDIAKYCGARCPEVYGDPGLLLPRFIPKPYGKRFDIGIVPHFTDYGVVKQFFSRKHRVEVIDVLRPVPEVVADIAASSVIWSSSLHGLIVADAYGIPSRWVTFSQSVLGDGTKFHDHFLATGREPHEPHEVYWHEPEPLAMDPADPAIIERLQEGLWASKPF